VLVTAAQVNPSNKANTAANLKAAEGTIGMLETNFINTAGNYQAITNNLQRTIVTVSRDGLARWETYQNGVFLYGGTDTRYFNYP